MFSGVSEKDPVFLISMCVGQPVLFSTFELGNCSVDLHVQMNNILLLSDNCSDSVCHRSCKRIMEKTALLYKFVCYKIPNKCLGSEVF